MEIVFIVMLLICLVGFWPLHDSPEEDTPKEVPTGNELRGLLCRDSNGKIFEVESYVENSHGWAPYDSKSDVHPDAEPLSSEEIEEYLNRAIGAGV